MPHGSLCEIVNHHNPCNEWLQEAGRPVGGRPFFKPLRPLHGPYAAPLASSCSSEAEVLPAATRSAFSSFLGGLPSMAFEHPDDGSQDVGWQGQASPFGPGLDALGGSDDPGMDTSLDVRDVDLAQDDGAPPDLGGSGGFSEDDGFPMEDDGYPMEGPLQSVEEDGPMMGAPTPMGSDGPSSPWAHSPSGMPMIGAPSGMHGGIPHANPMLPINGPPSVGTVRVDYWSTSGPHDDDGVAGPMLIDGEGSESHHDHDHSHHNIHSNHGDSHKEHESGHHHDSRHSSKSDRIKAHENKMHDKHVEDSAKHRNEEEHDSGHHPLIIINDLTKDKGYQPITVAGALVASFAQLYLWGTVFVTLFKQQRRNLDSTAPSNAPNHAPATVTAGAPQGQAAQQEQGNPATGQAMAGSTSPSRSANPHLAPQPLAAVRFSGASGQPGFRAPSSVASAAVQS